jgi:hypothetical protein
MRLNGNKGASRFMRGRWKRNLVEQKADDK